MNRALLRQYIELYKTEFEHIRDKEIYKWRAVKHFQETWDLEASDFRSMLEEALSKTKNLLSSGNYYAWRMIMFAANHQPERVREAFRQLYKDEIDLQERIENFRETIKKILAITHPRANHYQDDRAILVYLCLKYPDDYYLYKFQMFKDFCQKVKYDYKLRRGSFTNIRQYFYVCDLLLAEIQQDNELLKLHNGRIDKQEYFDKKHHILTQDIIYAISRYLTIDEPVNAPSRLSRKHFTINPRKREIKFTARKTDYQVQQHRNTAIGKAGELLVLKYEKEHCLPKWRSKIKHISADKGDGLGYDILSFDEFGNEKFIEVKTTTRDEKAAFFITAHELAISQLEAEKFYLYRLFNYDKKGETADFFVIKGDLTRFCQNPSEYLVEIDEIKDNDNL